MTALVRDVAFGIAMVSGLAALISLFLFKRQDVTWTDFLLAGPLTILRPADYLRPGRTRIPPALFTAGMVAMGVVWITSWIVDNV